VQVYDGGDLAKFLAPLEAVFVRLAYRIDDSFLEMGPKLRWLCSPTTGHNHIDAAALVVRGIQLLSLRGERTFLDTIRATPEHTLGLILALLRRHRQALDDIAAGRWDRDACRGEELFGNKVGIVGLGRVGYRLASYLSAFGADVVWCDPADVPSMPEWQRFPSILNLIESSRIVVLCASYHTNEKAIVGKNEGQASSAMDHSAAALRRFGPRWLDDATPARRESALFGGHDGVSAGRPDRPRLPGLRRAHRRGPRLPAVG
jgi:D-3-phosphoglycerate dehydrogenase